MTGIAWLILSWVLVGIICYLIVFKLGRQQSSDERNNNNNNNNEDHHRRGTSSNNPLLDSYTTDEKSKYKNASFWANSFINWIYSYSGIKFRQFHFELLNAIDDAARRLLHDEHYDLRIDKNNLEEGQIEPPEISNLQLIDGPVDQISGRAHIFIKRATLKLLTSKRKNDRFIVNNYEALLTNINANIDLRIATIAGHTHLIICFAEAPTSEIMLYDVEEGRVTGPEAVEIHDIICKAVGASIVNFKLESLISSNDKNYNSPSSSDVNDIVKRFYRSTDNAEQNSPPLNKLHVNVIRAYDLSINDSNNQQPFVVIEMDEPQRKYITNYGQSSSPNWNEHYDFDLSNGSDEILFEIYNPSSAGGGSSNTDNTFLGLAIVGINELIKTNNPTQYLKLQGRPYHNDNVNGTLLVEFTFSYDPNVSLIGTHTTQTRLINRDGDQLSETIKHSIRPLGDSLGSLKNGTHLEPIPTKTTTVTVKGYQKTEDGPHASLYDSYMNYDPHDTVEPERRQPSEEHSQSTIINRQTSVRGQQPQQQQFQQQLHQQQQQHQQPGTPLTKEPPLHTPDSKAHTFTYDHNELPPYMNRPLANSRSGSEKRKRERSFFGDLKERLNKKRRSYGRSKSADPATSQNLIETESYPPSRDQSQGPYYGKEYDDHARYTGDDSKCTLVLELQRSGETKYILIPPSIAREPAAASILKKGKKLHLCQNHTFVAVKSSCGISCNACNGKIASGFNKQAYQCRACRMVCHKACHTHIQAPCIDKNSMQLASAKDIDWAHYLRHSQLGEYISAENL